MMKKIVLFSISSVFTFGVSPPVLADDQESIVSPWRSMFARNKGSPQEKGFIADSELSIQLKNFWIDDDNRAHDDKRGQVREWGQGVVAQYKSGFTQGTVGFGIDAIGMFGIRLDSGGRAGKKGVERTPGNIFPLKHGSKAKEQLGSFGITPKMRFSKTTLQYGSLMPKLPVVGSNNERMLPQTYDGGMITVKELQKFTFVAGKLEHVKDVNSSNKHTLAVVGAKRGVGSNKFYFGGVDFNPSKDLLLQYYYANLEDFYVQHFLGLTKNWLLPAKSGDLKLDLRYFDSDSDGKNSHVAGRAKGYTIKGYKHDGEVDSRIWSGLFSYSVKRHQISAGYQVVLGRSNFPFISQVTSQGAPVASAYLFTNSQIGKFINSGQRTWMLGYSYNFADLGMPGLTIATKYLRGDHVRSALGKRKEWERDLIVAYKVQTGALRGLELSWRNASMRTNVPNTKDLDRNRLIATYEFKFKGF